MVSLATVGTVLILAGAIFCTDKADNYWRTRHPQPKPQIMYPPFITSLSQCQTCGTDGDLLNLDRQCLTCFHLKAHA